MLNFNPTSALQAFSGRADWVGLRRVRERTRFLSIRNDQPDKNDSFLDEGVMIEVLVNGHIGYAGTSDLSSSGLERAFVRALEHTKAASAYKVFNTSTQLRPKAVGEFHGKRKVSLDGLSLEQILFVLQKSCASLKGSDRIVNRVAGAMIVDTEIEFHSTNGSSTFQDFQFVTMDLSATAAQGSQTQTRTLNGMYANAHQTGAEAFDALRLTHEGTRIGREADELMNADDCPSEITDLILMPDQMMLQIHESIGHPLEIDRILGDERNYAGWSFVKPEDFGHLQYGSKAMNVVFDPTVEGEFASYAFDDGGNPSRKEHLIKDGVLLRGLGSLESQTRSGLKGVANFRSASWNRAPIDRMANINLEPGTASLEDMISQTERGVLMTANRSWSIDDYRNKFQFGCEYARLIENGQLTKVLKNPNYRGTTVDFWNRLHAVGSPMTVETFGTPYCGKGEPNQVIRVGHASPACLFKNVAVFGGGA